MNENKWQIRYREIVKTNTRFCHLLHQLTKKTIGLKETTKESGYWILMLASVPICHSCPVLPRKSKIARQLHIMVKNQSNTLEISNVLN